MHWRGTIHECSAAPACTITRAFLLPVLGPNRSSHKADALALLRVFFLESGFWNLCRVHQFGRKNRFRFLLASNLEHGRSWRIEQ